MMLSPQSRSILEICHAHRKALWYNLALDCRTYFADLNASGSELVQTRAGRALPASDCNARSIKAKARAYRTLDVTL